MCQDTLTTSLNSPNNFLSSFCWACRPVLYFVCPLSYLFPCLCSITRHPHKCWQRSKSASCWSAIDFTVTDAGTSLATEVTSNQLNWLGEAAEMDIGTQQGPGVLKTKSMAKLHWRQRGEEETGNFFFISFFCLSFTQMENNLGCQGAQEVSSSVPWSKQVYINFCLFRSLLQRVLVISEDEDIFILSGLLS